MVFAFDYEDEFKKMSKEEQEITLRHMISITKLEKEGKTKEEIEEIIKKNREEYLGEIKLLDEK